MDLVAMDTVSVLETTLIFLDQVFLFKKKINAQKMVTVLALNGNYVKCP